MRRACTAEPKNWLSVSRLRQVAGRTADQRHSSPPFAVQWVGISVNEWRRMKDSQHGWIENAYPLVDMRMSRQDCLRWIRKRYPKRPLLKSACISYPYHSNRKWLRIHRQFPEEAKRAATLDEHLRAPDRSKAEPKVNTQQFLHRSRRPLTEALEHLDYLDRLQPSLLPESPTAASAECGGYCYT